MNIVTGISLGVQDIQFFLYYLIDMLFHILSNNIYDLIELH